MLDNDVASYKGNGRAPGAPVVVRAPRQVLALGDRQSAPLRSRVAPAGPSCPFAERTPANSSSWRIASCCIARHVAGAPYFLSLTASFFISVPPQRRRTGRSWQTRFSGQPRSRRYNKISTVDGTCPRHVQTWTVKLSSSPEQSASGSGAAVVEGTTQPSDPPGPDASPKLAAGSAMNPWRIHWVTLLKRTCDFDALSCPCGGRL